jgi:hypothetical protein
MDRPSNRPDPIEPNEPTDEPPSPATPAEPSADTTEATGTADTEDVTDTADAADERERDAPERPAITPPADDPLATVHDTSDRLPANLREQMRQDPTFTRLGWGIDNRPQKTDDAEPDDAAEGIRPGAGQDAPRIEARPQELSRSAYAEVVAEHDKHWDAAEANLPPGRLPESAKDLDTEVVESMDPDVRRLLEYQGAKEYIAGNAADRPLFKPASDASPAVQRIFTAIDQGAGHAHIRHGPVGNDQMYADRVAYLEDPAQVDDAKRAAGIDGLNPSKMHRCGREATRIHDAEAFVAAFAAAVKLDEVQAALATPVGPTIDPPDSIKVPISELLGPEGHRYCSGYRLEGGPEAWQARKEWLQARAQGADVTGMPEPSAARIETFEGGNVIIRFKSNGQAYEITTLFVEPVADH